MSTIQDSRNPTSRSDETVVDRDRPLTVADAVTDADADADTIDPPEVHDAPTTAATPRSDEQRPVYGPVEIDPSGRIPWRGMRIRRVRLKSVAKLSFIFWLLAFAVLLGSTVLVWNVARAFGFITDMESAVITSLGIDAFEIDGGALFGIAAAVVAFLATLGWVMTILLAAVYNASGAVFGGLAVETGPLKRRKRVFSLRHRGFVTIRS